MTFKPIMKLQLLEEPKLVFARNEHVCPRAGIARYDVYDARFNARRDQVLVGIVGNEVGIEKVNDWLQRCSHPIPAKLNNKQPNLFPEFPGFHRDSGFKARLTMDERNTRSISNRDVRELIKIKDQHERIEASVDAFYNNIKFLCENRQVDVVVCVIPEELYKVVYKREIKPVEETAEEDENEDIYPEMNFRRALKAKAMHLGKPIQLIRESNCNPSVKGRQDDASKAWNFCTALYYKTNRTVPWRLVDNPNKPTVCYIGIGFYRSRDGSILQTSLAQVFDELGSGVILRGTPVQEDKDDRRPYLDYNQAAILLRQALDSYITAMETYPSRVVIHKSSNFRDEEIEGFQDTLDDLHIRNADYVTIAETDLRLVRHGLYPPYRGTRIELDEETDLLYTRGSVDYYKTYPGLYIPQPLEIRMRKIASSPLTISNEVLALSKMNWNDTQFDGKYPITIQCARKVGEIMKYIDPADKPQSSYSFYM